MTLLYFAEWNKGKKTLTTIAICSSFLLILKFFRRFEQTKFNEGRSNIMTNLEF